MTQYLIRRLLIAIPSIFGISIVLFTVLALAPGDPFEELATNPAVPPDVRAALRQSLGLDDPVHVRYIAWLTSMLRGDWGYSFVSRIPVDQLIVQRIPTTLYVIGLSQLVALAIALPVGVYAATRPYSVFDQIANTLAFIGFSLPTFFTGLLLILLFSIYLDWLPFVYRTNIEATGWRWWWEQFRQSIMPIMVLGLFQGAAWTRFVRSAVLDVIRLDHVTTARAKGLPEGKITIRHVVRNAMIPVVTLVALQMRADFACGWLYRHAGGCECRHPDWRDCRACRRQDGCGAHVAHGFVPVPAAIAAAAADHFSVPGQSEGACGAGAWRFYPDRHHHRPV
jgi:peptide/nickel transport system permease protein